jgi:hypothetical protein
MRAMTWIIGALVEVGLIVLTFVSNARQALLGSDPIAFYTVISLNIAFLGVWVGIKIDLGDRSLDLKLDDIERQLRSFASDRPGVSTLVDHDFYGRFGEQLRQASVGVAMAHLDTYPPNRPKKTGAAEYYEAMPKSIKSNPQAKFRRVERASPEKQKWLEELIKTFTGVANFSLAVLLLESRDRRTGFVSVQVIDDLNTILVAVAEHDSSFGPRDVWIRERGATALWKSYYDEALWRPAAKVLENGVLNRPEWDRTIKFIDHQCQNT